MAKNAVVAQETRSNPLIHKKINRTLVNVDSIYAMNRETDHKVQGRFVNVEAPGVSHKFSCYFYKDMEYFNEVLHDNVSCVIPYSVARFINEEWGYDQHSYLTDAQGNPMKSNKKISRGKFLIEQHFDK